MLKRIAHIIILIVLMVSTTGLTISKHYSQGDLFDVAFIGEADRCCSLPCDCCHDEFEFHRLVVDFVVSEFQISFDEIPTIDLLKINALIDIQLNLDSFSDDVEYATNLPPPEYSSSPSFTQSFLL